MFINSYLQPLLHTLLPSLQGVPEDLLFFYQSVRQGGGVARVDQCLLVYRYHEKATTHSVTESVPLSYAHTHTDLDTMLSLHLLTAAHWHPRFSQGSILSRTNMHTHIRTHVFVILRFSEYVFGIPDTFPSYESGISACFLLSVECLVSLRHCREGIRSCREPCLR